MKLTAKKAIELSDDDRSIIRLALEDRVVHLLQVGRKWTNLAEEAYGTYLKVGGYHKREVFERWAGI